MGKRAVVFGSFVVDLTARASCLPVPGETVKGNEFCMGPGGKGFNQAVAAWKAGLSITFATKIGEDDFGKLALKAMKELEMDRSRVIVSEEEQTGCALICVDDNSSQNQIIVVPGASETFTKEETASLFSLVESTDYLLMQLETNLEPVLSLAERAARKAVKILLNPAPAADIPDELYGLLDLITPNEVEAERLTGIPVRWEADAKKASDWFLEKGVNSVVITMGSKGAFCANGKGAKLYPAFDVKAVDTTGAGDAFNGALLAAMAEGKDMGEAVVFANAAAALSVQKPGTAPSMADRPAIEEFLKKMGCDRMTHGRELI